MGLNWDDMRFFLALSRSHTFLAAAESLGVTHSTVSRRISTLEASLGTRLFLRTEKGCTITSAGEAMLPFAERLESTVLNLAEKISGADQRLSGCVRIGSPDGIGNCYLAACLAELQDDHPDLAIELIPVPMYYSLSKREIDILITVKQPGTGRFIARRLTRYRLGLFAARSYLQSRPEILSKADLRGHRFVGYIDDLLFDEDLNFLSDFLPGVTPSFRSATVIAQLQAVAAGAGIGVIPYFMARNDHRLVPVLPDECVERAYWLQVNPDSRAVARVRTSIDFLVRRIGAHAERFLRHPSA